MAVAGGVPEPERNPGDRRVIRVANFVVFVLTISLIIGVTSLTGNLLLAPPYGVTAYLATFERKSRFPRPENIAVSYAATILSTEVLQSLPGRSAVAILLNVLIVAAFISFTDFEHPPAIALTIFSYIAHTTVLLVLASVAVVGIILIIRSLSGRTERKYLLSRWEAVSSLDYLV